MISRLCLLLANIISAYGQKVEGKTEKENNLLNWGMQIIGFCECTYGHTTNTVSSMYMCGNQKYVHWLLALIFLGGKKGLRTVLRVTPVGLLAARTLTQGNADVVPVRMVCQLGMWAL